MSFISTSVVIAALLGSALIGGVFFAFSSFIMKALARVPSSEGIAAMQTINVVVLNPSFLGVFIGTAALSVIVIAMSVLSWSAASPWYVAGALAYVVGTFLVTAFGNVPLNNQLADVEPTEPQSLPVWEHYLERWVHLNTLRTIAAAAAAIAFTVGLAL